MMEIFQNETDGRTREAKKLMGRRNYVAIVAYDPEQIAGGPGQGKLSLAADFMVQSEGGGGMMGAGGVSRYGPVIIPHLDFGR